MSSPIPSAMKHDTPLVSVLILTYNQQDTIARAIESVLAQQGGVPFEIIIGDDASTDATRQICLDYARSYPEVIRLMPEAPNKGLVDNYFDCLLAARGKYIADCAGDDHWCDPMKLAQMTAMLEADADATVAYSDTIFRRPDGKEELSSLTGVAPYRLAATRKVEGEKVLIDVLNHVHTLPYILSSAVYRRDAVMKVMSEAPEMLRNKDFGIEDVPVMAALASQGAALHYPSPTLVYEQREESVSNSSSLKKLIRFYCRSLDCARVLGEYYHVPQEAMKDNFNSKSRYLTGMAYNTGDRAMMELVSVTLSRWSLPLPFLVRIQLLTFSCAPVRSLITRLKRLIKKRS